MRVSRRAVPPPWVPQSFVIKSNRLPFQNAELQSERIRIFGVLGFIAIFIVVMAVRVFVIRTATRTTSWVWSFLAAVVIHV